MNSDNHLNSLTRSNEDSNPAAALPTFETESYRVVVESIRRDADNLSMTLVFESLADKTFSINWGDGRYNDNDIWESSEPYLIDENADRYYLRGQDTGKVSALSRQVQVWIS